MRFLRSPSAASAATSAFASFSAGTDSPVSADSSLLREALSIKRASAGTKSPASTRMMSPGTSLAASMVCSLPLRMTRAWGAESDLSASSAFSALLSCITPMMALAMTMPTMSSGSKNSEGSCEVSATTNEIAAAPSRIRIITSLNCSAKRWRLVFFLRSRRRFSPCSVKRFSASAEERPDAESASSRFIRSERDSSFGAKCDTHSFLICWVYFIL